MIGTVSYFAAGAYRFTSDLEAITLFTLLGGVLGSLIVGVIFGDRGPRSVKTYVYVGASVAIILGVCLFFVALVLSGGR